MLLLSLSMLPSGASSMLGAFATVLQVERVAVPAQGGHAASRGLEAQALLPSAHWSGVGLYVQSFYQSVRS